MKTTHRGTEAQHASRACCSSIWLKRAPPSPKRADGSPRSASSPICFVASRQRRSRSRSAFSPASRVRAASGSEARRSGRRRTLRQRRRRPPLHDVDEAFTQIAAIKGAGSTATRQQRLRDLLRRATRAEQDFIVRLLFGELRQGALEGVLVEAVAKASGLSAASLRRAVMMAGALAPVARAATRRRRSRSRRVRRPDCFSPCNRCWRSQPTT